MARYATTILAPLLYALFFLAGSTLAEEYFERTVYSERGVMDGPKRTEVASVSVNPPTWFGSIHMRDRSIADGSAENANIVGRVMDAAFKVVDGSEHAFYNYMVIEFKDDSRFNGSTLQVGGLNKPGDAEYAILGGTGNLTMARGIVRRTTATIPGPRNEELNIYAYYTPMPRMAVSGIAGCNCSGRDRDANV
ncbi:hypothetical protein EJB05_33582, partial [Eragrostis curvula]